MTDMIKQYRKKPIAVEAMRLTKESFEEACRWLGNKNVPYRVSSYEISIRIKTLEGTMSAQIGDWIIKQVK